MFRPSELKDLEEVGGQKKKPKKKKGGGKSDTQASTILNERRDRGK